MANLRQIRTRIRSVQNTQKITRAMQMVAGAKLRRAQEQLFKARPYVDRLEGLTRRFLDATPALAHPLLNPVQGTVPEGDCPRLPLALVIAATDTGLCGAYNERLLTMAREVIAREAPVQLVILGRKGMVAARRWGWPVLASHTDLGGNVTDALVQELAQTLIGAYQAGRVRGVSVLYTRFLSALSWRPTAAPWLPLRGPQAAESPTAYLTEPAPAAIAERLLPAYVTAALRRLLLEAVTAEHSARMMAMQAATDNAAEMIDTLTLARNKVRQASITKELSEIVAGAEALKA